MSMRIDREGTGYRLRLSSDRSKLIARNLGEVQEGVDHYFCNAHGLAEQWGSCPLCRAVRDEITARATRQREHREMQRVHPEDY